MKPTLLIAASLAVVSLAACKKEAPPAPDVATTAAVDPAAQEASSQIASPRQTFANVVAASDAFEVEASKLAATNGASAKIKAFADQMVKAHTDSTAKLKVAAAAASPAITPVATVSAEQQATLDDLKSKTGSAFDSAYAAAQVSAHQSALAGLKDYAAKGDVAPLKDFAAKLAPTVTAHLNMAKAL